MPLQMMYAEHRLTPGKAQTGGKAGSDQEGPNQAGTRGISHSIDGFGAGPRVGKGLSDQG